MIANIPGSFQIFILSFNKNDYVLHRQGSLRFNSLVAENGSD